jgi:hypothetical protein
MDEWPGDAGTVWLGDEGTNIVANVTSAAHGWTRGVPHQWTFEVEAYRADDRVVLRHSDYDPTPPASAFMPDNVRAWLIDWLNT